MTTQAKENVRKGPNENSSLLDTAQVVTRPIEMQLKRWHQNRSFVVDILTALFGISAWLSVNALFTQLPLIVQTAPEGWNLPSYLSLIIQGANVAPILYYLFKKFGPSFDCDSKIIYILLILSCVSVLLLSFLYSKTWTIANELHSGPLFVLVFFIAIVGCISSVLFIPFMNNYPEVYLISYMVGEGLGGFLPSVISLIQGVGGSSECVNVTSQTGETILVAPVPDPKFSSSVFFYIIFTILAISTIAFFLLNNLSTSKKQKFKKRGVSQCSTIEDVQDFAKPDDELSKKKSSLVPSSISPTMYGILLTLQAILSFFANGALNSIQSYSCLPYGNFAYHLTVNLGSIANPTACFIAYFAPYKALKWTFSLSGVIFLLIVYLFITALTSPMPPMQGSLLGVFLIVFTWVMCTALTSFVKLSIASVFRQEGGQGLFWYGAVTQVGAALGSLVTFLLINFTQMFISYDACIAE